MTVVALVIVAAVAMWVWKSLQIVGPSQVGIRLFFGKPIARIYKSGLVFVPYIPWKISDIKPWALARIPTQMFNLRYEGKEEHQIWSSDHQLLRVETAVYMRFPYNDADALVQMIRSNVPMREEKLQEWLEEEVIRVARQVMSKRGFKVTIEGSESAQVTDEANAEFQKPDGLLVRSGVYGSNVADTTPGKGEVYLKIEQVLLKEALQAQLEEVEAAKLNSTAATSRAQATAIEAGGPIDLLMDGWIRGEAKKQKCTVEEAKKRAHANRSWERQLATYTTFLLANSNNLTVNRVEIGGPDGRSLPSSLQYLAVGGAGGGAGVLMGGKRGKKGNPGGDNNSRGKPVSALSDKELSDEAFGK